MKRANACGNCRWWQTIKEYELTPTAGTTDAEGICRRMSPGVIDMEYRSWPGTLITDWCGEWTMTEEAAAEVEKEPTCEHEWDQLHLPRPSTCLKCGTRV